MKIHREGTEIIIAVGIAFVILNAFVYFYAPRVLFYVVLIATLIPYLGVINFFRSPCRHFQGDTQKKVVSSVDGKVVVVEEVLEDAYFHDKRLQISVFMTLVNVHANWFPVNGTVKHVSHQNGRFMAAYLPKSSTENERSTIVIETPEGVEILVRQIAGAMARRIVTYAEEGDVCRIDDHLGFIKFGSRVDIFLPLGSEVCVNVDEIVTGNQTVLAKLK